MPKQMWVYILSSPSRQLYIGVTNNLYRRWCEHQACTPGSYTSRHEIRRLVYYEPIAGQLQAIAREKTLKGWVRRRKIALIETGNPDWEDLAEHWGWAPSRALRAHSG
jgi:putative endonuclease